MKILKTENYHILPSSRRYVLFIFIFFCEENFDVNELKNKMKKIFLASTNDLEDIENAEGRKKA